MDDAPDGERPAGTVGLGGVEVVREPPRIQTKRHEFTAAFFVIHDGYFDLRVAVLAEFFALGALFAQDRDLDRRSFRRVVMLVDGKSRVFAFLRSRDFGEAPLEPGVGREG